MIRGPSSFPGQVRGCQGGAAGATGTAPAGPVSLPCLNSNNCDKGGDLQAFQRLQGNHKKTAFLLTLNIAAMIARHGLGRVAFFTLTFAEHVLAPKEAQRRLHNLARRVLSGRYVEYVRVFERQQSGRIHYHLLVVLPPGVDIRSGVDFEAFGRGDYRSAGPALRAEWAFWRQTARLYGFGRTELLPIRSTAEGVAKYAGKYIAKHVGARQEQDKGVRLVSYSSGTNRGSCKFGWVSPGSWLWRHKLAVVAGELGFKGPEDFSKAFGAKWAYVLAGAILSVNLSAQPGGVTYPTAAHARADGHSLPEGLDSGPVTITTTPKPVQKFEDGPVWAVPSWGSSWCQCERPSSEQVGQGAENGARLRLFASSLGPWSVAREETRYKDD